MFRLSGMPGKVQDRGKYLTVYVRDAEGALKIKVETWNTDVNPMETGAPGHDHGEHAEHEHDHAEHDHADHDHADHDHADDKDG